METPESKQNVVPFCSSNYITMENYDRRKKYKQKLRFRCYQDEDVFGSEIMEGLKFNQQDNDNESTYEQIKADISRGVMSIKEEI